MPFNTPLSGLCLTIRPAVNIIAPVGISNCCLVDSYVSPGCRLLFSYSTPHLSRLSYILHPSPTILLSFSYFIPSLLFNSFSSCSLIYSFSVHSRSLSRIPRLPPSNPVISSFSLIPPSSIISHLFLYWRQSVAV